ncbi:unnamed protein product [Prunus armeniaca]|uniref:Pentatricopeptide repeat-containing protein n=1 Tax=Prunus armeniaca TaxID=36596 RepID=A0A6J5WBL3_PRUAR|nr:unnamed protein product [Prunus armeniaca]CAB4297721.1 unnamed protein product [Prunus armeniaca]
MIKGYLRSGNLDEALNLFGKMNKRSIITLNSLITGFVQGGRPKEARSPVVIWLDRIIITSPLPVSLQLVLILVHLIMGYGCMGVYPWRSGLESDVVIVRMCGQSV